MRSEKSSAAHVQGKIHKPNMNEIEDCNDDHHIIYILLAIATNMISNYDSHFISRERSIKSIKSLNVRRFKK